MTFPGVVLVSSAGRSTSTVGGLADPATGRPWTPDTRSQIASISKQFVAVCVLTLVARGDLALDDPVTRHLPDAHDAWQRIRVRQLLTHTSGMTHWSERPGFVVSETLPVEQRLRLLLAGPPTGTGHLYSSPGYIVLAAIVAAAAGRPYGEVARELVVDRLGLTGTTLGTPDAGPVAVGTDGGEPVEPWDLGRMPGTGDVWSTAPDVARLVAAVHRGELLPAEVQPLLHGIRTPTGSAAHGPIRTDEYCAGHFLGSVDGRPACLHPGDNPGYQSLAVWLPDTETTVVALTNDESADIEAAVLAAVRGA